MRFLDLLRFAAGALRGHRLRTALSVTGVAVGIAAVVTLTAPGKVTAPLTTDWSPIVQPRNLTISFSSFSRACDFDISALSPWTKE